MPLKWIKDFISEKRDKLEINWLKRELKEEYGIEVEKIRYELKKIIKEKPIKVNSNVEKKDDFVTKETLDEICQEIRDEFRTRSDRLFSDYQQLQKTKEMKFISWIDILIIFLLFMFVGFVVFLERM